MRVTRFTNLFAIAALAMASTFAANASAAIIFDDFNANEGHFNQAPTASGQTNFTTASTADRITTDSLEGAGSEKLVLVKNTTPATNRVRFLSGAGGSPANNAGFAFTLSAGTDGWIGYYYKVVGTLSNATGMTMSLNLDGAGGTTAEMDGGVPKVIIADGAWHLVEWDLDNPADWGAVSGIGGGGHNPLANTAHTIDSIYLQNNTAAVGSSTEILIDFVAKSDSGSIANLLIPEPATLALAGMGLIGVCSISRRKNA